MSTEFIKIPIKKVNNDRWGQLSFFGKRHVFCGETIRLKNESYSFAGGHRVRLYSAEGNVHWLIPEGIKLDISRVSIAKELPTKPPRRMPKK
jgi:hypothetical protein